VSVSVYLPPYENAKRLASDGAVNRPWRGVPQTVAALQLRVAEQARVVGRRGTEAESPPRIGRRRVV